jgi:GNAT superfamily N-acetyltransferase
MDLVPLMILTEAFFSEAGWKAFSEFNETAMKETYEQVLNQPFSETASVIYIVDALMPPNPDEDIVQVPVGFIKFGIQCRSTVDPVGVLDGVFVLPEFRLSPAGRLLFAAAETRLRALGAWCFMASPGARIQGVDKSMANMLGKLGFEIETIKAVKILRETQS